MIIKKYKIKKILEKGICLFLREDEILDQIKFKIWVSDIKWIGLIDMKNFFRENRNKKLVLKLMRTLKFRSAKLFLRMSHIFIQIVKGCTLARDSVLSGAGRWRSSPFLMRISRMKGRVSSSAHDGVEPRWVVRILIELFTIRFSVLVVAYSSAT